MAKAFVGSNPTPRIKVAEISSCSVARLSTWRMLPCQRTAWDASQEWTHARWEHSSRAVIENSRRVDYRVLDGDAEARDNSFVSKVSGRASALLSLEDTTL